MNQSCTIIISHFESIPFLMACIRQIRKHRNDLIEQKIIVADQSSDKIHNDVVELFWGDPDITIIKMPPLYSGFGIDFIMHNVEIKTEYICQLHCDAYPIASSWLYLPIKLIEENNFSFVGQLHFVNESASIYPPNRPFFSMSPTFNVARTETYKEMSIEAGFTRFHNRPKCGLKFNNHDWDEWAQEDYDKRGSDDDTVAFCWEDSHRQHDKLGLRFTGMLQKEYGRIIEDVVFHFGSCCESRGVEDQMGEKYRWWTNKIVNGYDDSLIERLLADIKPIEKKHGGFVWDGKTKTYTDVSPELWKRIEELKNE